MDSTASTARSILSCPRGGNVVIDGIPYTMAELEMQGFADDGGRPTFLCPPEQRLAYAGRRGSHVVLVMQGALGGSEAVRLTGTLRWLRTDACTCCETEWEEVVMDVANVMLVRPDGEAVPIPLDAFTDRGLDLNDGVLHRNQDHLNNHHPDELRDAVATRTYLPVDSILATQITSLSADGFEFQWVDEHGAHSAHTTFDRPARTPEDLVAGVRKALAAEIC
ncbi:DUF2470 domain-containing protein [Nocardioides albus]|uniref:DUF2470 domain-containing protein n=1 Tax=Nocardioides albus TaxID=1841 RepID=A0A7W5A396_9ACTN|nr:DUF2470 domain-containing protein [Nocardioides albus]MBB3088595.1 hypothetical protein [Nocardioides albus]GGU17399.1 hypothetical protein GCM10007979_14870 [Nocardioides albus]